MKIIQLNDQTHLNETYLLIGLALIFFQILYKVIFYKNFNSLNNYKKFLLINQKSSLLLFIVYIFFSLIASYFVLLIYEAKDINSFRVKYFLLISANFFLFFCVKSIVYTILWFSLNLNRINIGKFLNINSYFLSLKIFFLTLCFFLYYFSPFSNQIILAITTSGILILFFILNFSLFIGLKANGVYLLHIPLYLILAEIFPLLYLYKTIETFL